MKNFDKFGGSGKIEVVLMSLEEWISGAVLS